MKLRIYRFDPETRAHAAPDETPIETVVAENEGDSERATVANAHAAFAEAITSARPQDRIEVVDEAGTVWYSHGATEVIEAAPVSPPAEPRARA